MTYYDVFLPLGDSDVNGRLNELNALLSSTYTAAAVRVADVAGVFGSAELVCAWTWFCSYGDVHPNTAGYGVIAQAFEQVVQ